MAKKFRKDFKGDKFDRRGPHGAGKTSDKNYQYGKGPGGNAYKTEGGYRNAGTAGIIPKVPDTIGSGKFGSSADVASKLTFGKYSAVIQPGFDNDIFNINNIESGTLGTNVNFKYNNQLVITPLLCGANARRTAGILAVHVNDYLGANNNEEKSPLNLAAQLNKQFIDTSLGEQLTFSSSDLGQYMGGVKSAWDFCAFIKRAINLSHNSKDRADYLTRGLYRAMRICKEGHPTGNPDPSLEIAGNSAVYLERMNGMIKRLNTVPVPSNMKWLVSYTDAMYSQIFQDEPGETAQFYVVVPNGVYMYDETATGPSGDPKEFYNGAELKWVAFDSLHGDKYNSIPELLDLLEIMTQALTTHTNSDFMAQKLLNAFGTANTLQIPTNQANDELVPIVYDEDFCSSLENAKIVRGLDTPGYTIDAAREMIVGRPLFEIDLNDGTAHGDTCVQVVNFPLQFHSGLDAIDDHAISNALRWHPYTSFVRYNSNTNKLEFDFANNFGMQVVTHLEAVYLKSAGDFDSFEVLGHWAMWVYDNALHDFKHLPIGAIYDNVNVTPSSSGINFQGIAYNARRDAEVSISGENVANYFWSLAEMVWDVVDGQTTFSGQRGKLG